jgi:FSR family fosmidomycin resistance protein-like MFS transporter
MKTKFQTGKVITLSIGHFIHDVYTSFLSPLLPLLIEKLSISYTLAGMLDVVRRIPSLLNPLIGLMADRICVKYLIILAPAASTITSSLLGLAPSYPIIVVLLFTTGISSSLFHIPSPVAIKRFSGDKTGLGMSFYMVGGEFARSVGPLLIIAAVSYWGLEGSYKVMPLGLLATVILYFKLRNVEEIVNNSKKQKVERDKQAIKKLIPLFLTIAGFILFRASMKSALTLYLPTYLSWKGETLWLAGISLSVFQFAGAVGTLGAGYISDKIGRRSTLLITAVVSPFLMWAFIYSNNIMLFPVLIVTGILVFAQGPVLLALFQDTNTKQPAFVNSIYMTINFVINSLMVLFVGVLSDFIGLDLTFKISAIMAFIAIPFIYFMPKAK